MTWALASTAIVIVGVVAALAWFERTGPDARQVALVAALAALAVAGRLAFAPLPSVKPTTDLVFLAGFAFGATPGFVVGATAALVSNMAFGQGVHTPWQMLAWGGVGVVGALLARPLGRRPHPFVLALVCGLCAWGFSAFMDLSVWTQTAPGHTLDDLLAIVARGVPFTAAHVVGSVLFALAFGRPVLVALERAERRAHVVWLAPADG
ncbi:MAG: DUF6580 family putative transport protein [Solirubrobacteraceae bacterium]|nr:DUF6580 family putative transport protein [Patulibacter sp.]